MREDYRLFTCVRCHALVSICSACDRGQWYCGLDCSRQNRLEGVRAAGRRYQASRPGRHRHADRQARYRQRKRGEPSPEKVTHQGTPEGPEDATLPLATCQPEHAEGHGPVGQAVEYTSRGSGLLLLRCAVCTLRPIWTPAPAASRPRRLIRACLSAASAAWRNVKREGPKEQLVS